MLGAVASRERRGLWGTLALVLAVSIAFTMYRAQAARSMAADAAGEQARTTAQTTLPPLLTPDDLVGPIVGARYVELSAAIERDITASGPIEQVTIWSPLARDLFDVDSAQVGMRSSDLRQLIFEVATGKPRSDIANGTLRTFAPIWLEPDGKVVVAEMDQPIEPIASEANAPWYRLVIGLGAGLLLAVVLYALTFLKRARKRSKAESYEASRAARRDKGAGGDTPDYTQPGFRELEQASHDAEARAEAAEKNYRGLQVQYKATLEDLKSAEKKISRTESKPSKSDAPAADDPRSNDVVVLRAHLRDAEQRLSESEADRQALLERFTLQQQELEAARLRIRELERGARGFEPSLETEDAEIDTIQSRLHLKQLGEALREQLGGSAASEPDGDVTEQPTVIHTGDDQNALPATGKRGAE